MAAPVEQTPCDEDAEQGGACGGYAGGQGDGEVLAGYEYLDHTADVQLHSYGRTLEESFEMMVQAMFGYMTDIETVEMTDTESVEAEGSDMLSLLFHLMDEFLYVFSAEPFFIAREVKILEFDRENFKIKAEGYGETFDLKKHPQGTEVKAITYSNMQVHDTLPTNDCFVIIDI
ncbi:protein archease-like [Glandiceps talaboti]